MNEFFRRPSPPSSARAMHHGDSIAGETSSPLHHPNFNLGWRRRSNAKNKSINPDELSVTHLRRVYSTLLEEMAPSVHGTPNGKHYRWKNSGTVTMEGDDNEGYEYCYTPDNSQKSWRLNHAARPGMNDGRGKGSATNSTNEVGVVGGGMIGITGGDWSIDGIRRYHTGGSILVEPPKYYHPQDGAAATKEESGRDDNNERSSNILRVGSMDVDVGLMNGVVLSPVKLSVEITDINDGEVVLQSDLTFDDNNAVDVTTNDLHKNSTPDLEQGDNELSKEQEYHDAQLSSVVESYATTSSNQNTAIPKTPFDKSTNLFDNGLISLNSASNSNSNTMTAFESLYHLSPSMAWRLRSAYAPTTPQEEHFMSVGSEILTQRHPDKADGIMRGLAMTRQCESRVCDGLRKIGELISYCERIKGSRNLSSSSTPSLMTGKETPPTDTIYTCGENDREEFNEEDTEVAEAMFGYFCEKNVLPMLIDSLLCHPPAMTPSDTIVNAAPSNSNIMNTLESSPHSPSPFSGVNWTASVKSQILQTIAMILFNTSSPLSLTYLLSNNYMNELIMGMLPLDRWRADALEEILPPYVTLLRGLVMRLRGDEGKCCLPLFLCQRKRRNIPSKDNDNVNENDAIATTETYLPLLYAAVQVFCSSYGTSLRDSEGCLIRTTAMNVILNLARMSDPEMRMVLVVGGGDAVNGSELPTTKFTPTPSPLAGAAASLMSSPLTLEQELLFPHICNSLNSWFHRSVRLVMASLSVDDKSKHHDAKLEAKARHKDIAEVQFRELQYWLGFLDDLLSCDIRIWNARLVECTLRDVVVGTVLLRWNRSLDVIERNRNDRIKSLPEIYKAHAEIRVSIVFLTQLFGMVEYSPLVRLVGTLVLHPNYPSQWCCLDNDAGGSDGSAKGDGSFVITTAINSMINDATATSIKEEEADAGAGRQPNASSETISKFQDPDDCRALESGDLDHALQDLSENLDQLGSSNNQLIPNRHREAILDMLGGRYSSDETILVSILLATILENEAIDDIALEIFGVLPSPVNDDGNSPFELSIATYLTKNWSTVDSKSYLASGNAIESVSTLGFMLLERLIFHTWTEGGQCTDVIPFHHYFMSSAYIEALGSCLAQFVSRAQTHLHDASSIREIFSDLIRRRYSRIDENNSPLTRRDSVKLVCFLQSYYPSNFIDNLSVLTGDMIYGGSSNENISQGDLFLFNDDNEAAKFAVRVTLHLRSILGCIQDFYQRFSFDSGSPWYSGGESFAFSTTETADEILMSIGGIESIPLPNVGADIDLRGRKFFLCSLPTKSKHGHIGNTGMIICANGSRIAVTEKTDLVLIVDALHIFVAKEKRDYNRCTVLSVIPVRTIVASATEGEIFHIVCHTNETFEKQGDLVKDGRLSLRFGRGDTCVSVKECVDKHCIAFENKVMLDMADMLEKCSLIGSGTNLHSSLQSIDIDDSWNDFQHA